MRLILDCVSHLWWTVCNSKPKSHSGSGEMGPGTEEEEGAIKTTCREKKKKAGTLVNKKGCEELPWGLGKETWAQPVSVRLCWSQWHVLSPRCLSSGGGWCSPTAPTPAGGSAAPLQHKAVAYNHPNHFILKIFSTVVTWLVCQALTKIGLHKYRVSC